MKSQRHIGLLLAVKKGYFVKDGHVFNKTGKERKLNLTEEGYFTFSLYFAPKKIIPVAVHRLVAFQKFGKLIFKKELQIRHLDCDKKNNLDENILMGTGSQNQMDIPKSIRIERAIKATNAVKKHAHQQIIEMHKAGSTYSQIQKKFGITSKGTISFIINKSMAAK